MNNKSTANQLNNQARAILLPIEELKQNVRDYILDVVREFNYYIEDLHIITAQKLEQMIIIKFDVLKSPAV